MLLHPSTTKPSSGCLYSRPLHSLQHSQQNASSSCSYFYARTWHLLHVSAFMPNRSRFYSSVSAKPLPHGVTPNVLCTTCPAQYPTNKPVAVKPVSTSPHHAHAETVRSCPSTCLLGFFQRAVLTPLLRDAEQHGHERHLLLLLGEGHAVPPAREHRTARTATTH